MDETINSIPPPQQQMPIYAGNPYDTAAIAHMRWKDNDTISDLKQQLGGYITVIDEQGNIKNIQVKNNPLMNEEGVNTIVSEIQSIQRPGLALTLFDETHAAILERQKLNTIVKVLAAKKEQFGIRDAADLYTIRNIITPIIDAEIHRPINGHESRNFKTDTVEQTLKQDQTMSSNSPGLFSWGKRR